MRHRSGGVRLVQPPRRPDAGTTAVRRCSHANRDTWFGVRHGFDRIATLHAYQQRVPPATYADFDAADSSASRREKPNVLTAEPVTLLEPTSGTTGGEKLIPYTAGLRRQFQRGVAAWIADLFCRRPAVRRGRAYWSISPALGPPRTSPGGMPIGFADDAEYLGRLDSSPCAVCSSRRRPLLWHGLPTVPRSRPKVSRSILKLHGFRETFGRSPVARSGDRATTGASPAGVARLAT